MGLSRGENIYQWKEVESSRITSLVFVGKRSLDRNANLIAEVFKTC